MTIQDKNIAIAEMLRPKYIGYFKESLKFHSDANWQFEALDFIEKLSNDIETYHFCMLEAVNASIRVRNNQTGQSSFEWLSVFQKGYHQWTRKEAIFEALYQFSQYLKNK